MARVDVSYNTVDTIKRTKAKCQTHDKGTKVDEI